MDNEKDKFSIDDILDEYSNEGSIDITALSDTEIADLLEEEDDVATPAADKGKASVDAAFDYSAEAAKLLSEPVEEKTTVIPDVRPMSRAPFIPSEPISKTIVPDEPARDSTLKLKPSYIDRSATRIADKPNMILKNPKNNIRYANKNQKPKRPDNPSQPSAYRSTGQNVRPAASTQVINKADLSVNNLNTKNIRVINDDLGIDPTATTAYNAAKNRSAKPVQPLQESSLPTGSTPKKKKHNENLQINVKATPDVDFFSIDVKIDDGAQRSHKHKHKDTNVILNDLYDLKSSLTARFLIITLAFFLSFYINFATENNFPLPEMLSLKSAPQAFVFVHLIAGVIAFFASLPVVISGFKKLFTMKSDCDTIATIGIAASVASCIAFLFKTQWLEAGGLSIFMPIAILTLLFNSFGKLLIVNRAISNWKFISNCPDKYAVNYVHNEEHAEQITRGTLGDYPVLAASRKVENVSNFLRYTYSSDSADAFCKYATPALLVVSLLIAGAGTAIKNPEAFDVQYALAMLSICISAAAFFAISIVVNMPLSSAAKKFNENSGAILGYQSIDDFYDTNSAMIDVTRLFPEDSITLSAIKIFSDTKIDDAIIEAASLTYHSNSILSSMFVKVIDGKTDMLHKVENYIYEDSMGLCGWINNKRVLLGNRELMVNHSIEGLPPVSKEKEFAQNGREAVYLSISGNLAAMFIVEIKADSEVKEKLGDLVDNGICLMLRNIDSTVSISKLSDLFDIPEDMIKIIPYRLQKYYLEETEPKKEASASIVCNSKLGSFAELLISTKRLRSAVVIGIILQCVAAILGIAFIVLFMCINSIDEIKPSTLLMYNLIWCAITALIVKMKNI